MKTVSLVRPMSRDKSDTLLLLATCALVLAPHAGHLPLWIPLVCAVLLLWRGWITFQGERMPPRWLLLPTAVVAVACAYWTYKTIFGREVGVAMLALLLSFKLLEMRAKRDLFVVLFLNFFLMLASFFHSQSIGSAALMILSVVAILTTQLSFQYTGAVPPLAQRLRLGAWIVALAIPVTLVLFFLFPRIQGPLWGLPSDADTGRTGLSDTMAPGHISKLAQSDDIVFRVKFIDPPPPQAKLYWRGIVLGDYDGRTWTRLRRHAEAAHEILVRPRGMPIRQQITLEPSGRPWLFALELPQAPPQLPGNLAMFSVDLQLLAMQPINERIRYDAVSYTDFDLQPNAAPAALSDWLELPPGYNPDTRAFAAQLHRQSRSHIDIVNAALRFFREQEFRYTLEPPPLGRNAVDEFLFRTRAGFCEHYAGAFVALMRAAGVPSRVVTGYQGGEINPVDGYMTVRQSDAHAWAEVWLENRGWLRIDPTAAVAPERIEKNLASAIPHRLFGGLITLDQAPHSWLSKLRLNWDAMTNTWDQWILNYSLDKQKNVLRSLGFEQADWRTLVSLMFALGAFAMAAAAFSLLRNRQKSDPLDAIYVALCSEMARRGLPRVRHEGPQAYCARLTDKHSPLGKHQKKTVAQFLQLYEAAQYGATDTMKRSAVLSQLKSLLAQCR